MFYRRGHYQPKIPGESREEELEERIIRQKEQEENRRREEKGKERKGDIFTLQTVLNCLDCSS